jgi:hypothetical protein
VENDEALVDNELELEELLLETDVGPVEDVEVVLSVLEVLVEELVVDVARFSPNAAYPATTMIMITITMTPIVAPLLIA